MDSNVSKNTFCYKFFNLGIAQANLAIEQLLKQQLLAAIQDYRAYTDDFSQFELIKTLIDHKISLCRRSQNYTSPIRYRCAIAFPLANFWQLSPLTVAQKLSEFLPTTNVISTTQSLLKFKIQIVPPGWIDFYLSDRALAVWLEALVDWINREETKREGRLDGVDEDLFALQYIHARCCSLLRLGEREKLIKIKHQYLSSWAIVEPFPPAWLDAKDNFLLVHPTEKRLLIQLLIVVEKLITHSQKSDWAKLAHNLSEVFLDFWADCRIYGEVKLENPELAKARLGLVALVQHFLAQILQDKLHLIPLTEI